MQAIAFEVQPEKCKKEAGHEMDQRQVSAATRLLAAMKDEALSSPEWNKSILITVCRFAVSVKYSILFEANPE